MREIVRRTSMPWLLSLRSGIYISSDGGWRPEAVVAGTMFWGNANCGPVKNLIKQVKDMKFFSQNLWW